MRLEDLAEPDLRELIRDAFANHLGRLGLMEELPDEILGRTGLARSAPVVIIRPWRPRAQTASRRKGQTKLAATAKLVRHPLAALLLVLVGCLSLRLAVLASSAARLDSDEAVTGIMARRILEGRDFYLYYAGQKYMGAPEQYLQAASLALFPDGPFSLRVPEVLLSVATCGLTYVVGARIFRSRWLGVLAAALYAAGPYFTVIFGVKAGGALGFGTLVGLAGIWIATLFGESPRRDPWLAAGFGLACGLGFWALWGSALLFLPAAIWIIGSGSGRLARLFLPAGLGFAAGAAPVWIFIARHGSFPTPLELVTPPTTIYERADTLIGSVLPMLLGLKLTNASALANWLPSELLLAVVLAAFGVVLYRRRHGVLAALTFRPEARASTDLVVLAFLLLGPIWLTSEFAYFTGEPRYLQPLSPLLAIGLAGLVSAARGRQAVVTGIALVLITGALTAIALNRVIASGGTGAVVAGSRIHTECLPEVVDVLRGEDADAVYADYWLAYTLQFIADDGIAVAPSIFSRFPDLTAAVEHDPAPAYVVPSGQAADSLAGKLNAAGSRFNRRNICSLAVFANLRPVVRPAMLGSF